MSPPRPGGTGLLEDVERDHRGAKGLEGVGKMDSVEGLGR